MNLKMQWKIENKVMITIKYLQINKNLALNNSLGVDMPWWKWNRVSFTIDNLKVSLHIFVVSVYQNTPLQL